LFIKGLYRLYRAARRPWRRWFGKGPFQGSSKPLYHLASPCLGAGHAPGQNQDHQPYVGGAFSANEALAWILLRPPGKKTGKNNRYGGNTGFRKAQHVWMKLGMNKDGPWWPLIAAW
jgi:hypothetical protein